MPWMHLEDLAIEERGVPLLDRFTDARRRISPDAIEM